MAGISDNHTASDSPPEWLFITTAIELVARYMPQGGAQEAAKEFLLTELHAKRIRYRYYGRAKYDGWVFPLDYLWLRDDKSITHEITADAAVIRRGITLVRAKPPPPMRRRRGFERLNPGARDNEERYVFDPHRRTTVIRLKLVQLHQGDILRQLQERGFLPMQQELPLSAPTMPLMAKECSAWDPNSEWSVERALQELEISGSQQEAIAAKVPELSRLRRRYRDKSIVEILDDIRPADLARAVGCSPDSCERFLHAWKAYRIKQRG